MEENEFEEWLSKLTDTVKIDTRRLELYTKINEGQKLMLDRTDKRYFKLDLNYDSDTRYKIVDKSNVVRLSDSEITSVVEYDDKVFKKGKYNWRLPSYKEYVTCDILTVGLWSDSTYVDSNFFGTYRKEPSYWCKSIGMNNDADIINLYGSRSHYGRDRTKLINNNNGHALDRDNKTIMRIVRINPITNKLEWLKMSHQTKITRMTWFEARALAQSYNK